MLSRIRAVNHIRRNIVSEIKYRSFIPTSMLSKSCSKSRVKRLAYKNNLVMVKKSDSKPIKQKLSADTITSTMGDAISVWMVGCGCVVIILVSGTAVYAIFNLITH